MIALAIWIYLASMNVLAFAAFAWDKSQARVQGWRVREDTLLFLALIGGWPGAKIAQQGFRHKTRKQPFGSMLNAIPFVWLTGAGFAWWLWPG